MLLLLMSVRNRVGSALEFGMAVLFGSARCVHMGSSLQIRVPF